MTLEMRENISLAPLTTLKIGGEARYLITAASEADVVEAFAFAKSRGQKLFILGGGSNLLVADSGFDGVVLKIELKGRSMDGNADGPVIVRAAAGEDWDEFVEYCVAHDLAGVECLSGIPGLVGGTPVQNVGAYGQEVAETIREVRCFDRLTREIVVLAAADCGFTYRTSIFNSTDVERFIVLQVTFQLQKGGEPKIAYKDLAAYFGERRPTLSELRRAVLKIRSAKSMVIRADDPDSKSAGSFFKNPVITPGDFDRLRTLFPKIPHFEFGENVKIPAAWLIENAGFEKGASMGNAGISTKHTLALINRGNATAAEIVMLKDAIQAAVSAKFGITLVPEPVFLGF